MKRTIGIYGGLAGAIGIGLMAFNMSLGIHSLFVGYVILFAAMSLIFFSIKRYRDVELGGVIRFGTAARLGLGITAVASLVYVLGWELYLWATDYSFFDQYLAAELATKRAAGASAAELARMTTEMTALAEQYNSQFWFRAAFTLFEIVPVGLLVTLVSAALLRKSDFLPARAGRAQS